MTKKYTKILCVCIIFMSVGHSNAMDEFEPYELLPCDTYLDVPDLWQVDFLDSGSVAQSEASQHVLQPIECEQPIGEPLEQPVQMFASVDNPQSVSEEAHLLPEVHFQAPSVSARDRHMLMASLDISVVRQLYELIVQLKKCIYDVHQKVLEQERRLDGLRALVQGLSRSTLQVQQKIQIPVVAQAGPVYHSQEQPAYLSSEQQVQTIGGVVPAQQTNQTHSNVYMQPHGSPLYNLLRNRYLQVQREREYQNADIQVGLTAKKPRT
jgi:hypothetical protein